MATQSLAASSSATLKKHPTSRGQSQRNTKPVGGNRREVRGLPYTYRMGKAGLMFSDNILLGQILLL